MTEAGLAVVHFLDKKLLKGTTQDFFPNRPLFHLTPAGGGDAVEVRTNLLKAVFFVKNLEGNPRRARP